MIVEEKDHELVEECDRYVCFVMGIFWVWKMMEVYMM